MSGKHTGTLLALALVLANYAPASAQVIVGGTGQPSVEINQGVLDRLGDPPSLSDLFLGRQPVAQPTAVAFTSPSPSGLGSATKLRKPHGHVSVDLPTPAKPVAKKAPKVEKTSAVVASEAPQAPSPAKLPVIVPKVEEVKPAPAPAPVAVVPPPAPAPAPIAAAPAPVAPTAAPTPLTPEPAPPAPTPAPVAAVPPPAPIIPAPVAPAPVAVAPPPAAVVAAPAAVPAPPALEAPQEARASAAPASALPIGLGDGGTTIPFEKDAAHLPDASRTALATLASRMANNDALQVQLLAYAEGDEDNAGKARRLSLSRALAVRSFLIDQGVRSTRIEVRALGNKVPDGNADRVDVVVQKH